MINLFDDSIRIKIYNLLVEWGIGESFASVLDGIIVLIYLALVIVIINLALRWGVMRGLQWLVSKTRVWWDEDRKSVV